MDLRAVVAGERLLFRRLGVFAGPAGVDTIEAVCAMPDGDKPVLVLDALEGLLEFSLVRRDERTDQSRRFTMPQALRDFREESWRPRTRRKRSGAVTPSMC